MDANYFENLRKCITDPEGHGFECVVDGCAHVVTEIHRLLETKEASLDLQSVQACLLLVADAIDIGDLADANGSTREPWQFYMAAHFVVLSSVPDLVNLTEYLLSSLVKNTRESRTLYSQVLARCILRACELRGANSTYVQTMRDTWH